MKSTVRSLTCPNEGRAETFRNLRPPCAGERAGEHRHEQATAIQESTHHDPVPAVGSARAVAGWSHRPDPGCPRATGGPALGGDRADSSPEAEDHEGTFRKPVGLADTSFGLCQGSRPILNV
jgi:hypothetical protein